VEDVAGQASWLVPRSTAKAVSTYVAASIGHASAAVPPMRSSLAVVVAEQKHDGAHSAAHMSENSLIP
jgi:hypothetical protein